MKVHRQSRRIYLLSSVQRSGGIKGTSGHRSNKLAAADNIILPGNRTMTRILVPVTVAADLDVPDYLEDVQPLNYVGW